MKIKELPEEQRPYEKCLSNGSEALSDAELLAVILRSGTRDMNSLHLADTVLSAVENTAYPGLQGLYHISAQDLMRLPGIGRVKAVQLKCIGELSRRIARSAAKRSMKFESPETVAQYYMEQLRHEEKEYLYCLMLDTKNHFMGEQLLSIGTVNEALVNPRDLFAEALRHQAVGIVIVHNHPSGDPSPSECDIMITNRIRYSGEMIGIRLLDHVIIGDQTYFSFREQGHFDEDAI